MTPDEAIERARLIAGTGRRSIIGVVGCPGSGKSTLTGRLVDALGPDLAVVVPMDGFHLDNPLLVAHGTRDRKGAPETFDAAGYAALLARLKRQAAGETIYAPRYDRAASASIAGAIEVDPRVPLVITEGNYLLLADGPWAAIRPLLDEAWFVDIADEVRVPRLIARHIAFGKSAEAAAEWVHRSDEANALLVKASAHRADAIVATD